MRLRTACLLIWLTPCLALTEPALTTPPELSGLQSLTTASIGAPGAIPSQAYYAIPPPNGLSPWWFPSPTTPIGNDGGPVFSIQRGMSTGKLTQYTDGSQVTALEMTLDVPTPTSDQRQRRSMPITRIKRDDSTSTISWSCSLQTPVAYPVRSDAEAWVICDYEEGFAFEIHQISYSGMGSTLSSYSTAANHAGPFAVDAQAVLGYSGASVQASSLVEAQVSAYSGPTSVDTAALMSNLPFSGSSASCDFVGVSCKIVFIVGVSVLGVGILGGVGYFVWRRTAN